MPFARMVDSPSNLVQKAHQQNNLKFFAHFHSDFFKHVSSSATSDAPNSVESPGNFRGTAKRTRLLKKGLQ